MVKMKFTWQQHLLNNQRTTLLRIGSQIIIDQQTTVGFIRNVTHSYTINIEYYVLSFFRCQLIRLFRRKNLLLTFSI